MKSATLANKCWLARTSSLLIIAFLSACATSGVHTFPASKREVLSRLGVATAHFSPNIVMNITRGKGHSAARGAAQAAAGSIEGGIQSGDGFAFLLSVLLVPVFAAGGAVYGAVAGDSTEDIQGQISRLDTIFYGTEMQRLLTGRLLEHTKRSSQLIVRSDLKGSDADGSRRDYRAEVGLDAVLEIGIREIRLEDEGATNSRVNLQVEGFSRMVRVSDGAVLMAQEYPYRSIDRDLDDWSRGEATLVREELAIAFDQIAGKMVDDYFIPVIALQKGHDALGATKPLPGFCFFCQAFLEPVKTSRPVLCWKPLTATKDSGLALDLPPGEVSGIVYDLNVSGLAGQTSFTRYDLDRNCYQLEKPLAPCQLQRWWVRARFQIDQTIYATPWISDARNRISTRCP